MAVAGTRMGIGMKGLHALRNQNYHHHSLPFTLCLHDSRPPVHDVVAICFGLSEFQDGQQYNVRDAYHFALAQAELGTVWSDSQTGLSSLPYGYPSRCGMLHAPLAQISYALGMNGKCD